LVRNDWNYNKKRIWNSSGILKITHFKRLFGGWEIEFENENKPVI